MNNRRFARTAGWLAVPCLVAAGLLAWYVTREPATPFADVQATAADPAFNGNGQTFQAGSGQQWVAPNDQFRRRLLVSTIQLRNMGL